MKLPKKQSLPGTGHGSDKFLKLKDGESKEGVFRGEPFEYRVKWNGSIYAPDPAGSFRYKLNFIVWDVDHFKALIWEFGQTIYDTLSEINVNMPLENTKIKITRKGSGTDTTYIIIPLGPVAKKGLELIAAVDLNILGAIPGSPSPAITSEANNGWDQRTGLEASNA